jgi:dTDP-4-dehydrorhamnose 3,5-epimerase
VIEGVVLRQLKQLKDDRGCLMEMLRSDWPEFKKFGQVYVTVCKPSVAKAWHYHKNQTDHFIVVKGMARIALFDNRAGSKTRGELNEFVIGEQKPALLVIPKGVVHGFTSATSEDVYIVNVPDKTYNYKKPDEFRLPFDSKEIPYDWRCERGG